VPLLAAVAVALLAADSAAAQSLVRLGAVPATQPLRIVLPLSANYGALNSWAQAVSTPGSGHYQQFEPVAELARRFGASAATETRVLGYLRRAGAGEVRVDATGLFIDATVPAAQAERLFATPLARFHADREGVFVAPTAPAAVPAPLRGLVTGVIGLSTQPIARHASEPASDYPTASGTQAGCSAGKATGGFTPNQYLTAYNFDALHQAGLSGQGERVALIELDGFKESDLTKFTGCFGLGSPTVINVYGVGGVTHPLPPGGESTLDLEVLSAAAPDLRSIEDYETNADASDLVEAFTAPLQNPGHKPNVISASLGLCEPQLQGSVGNSGVRSLESALAMMAASGVTFVAASGDDGSADCTDSNGNPLHELAVNYPASSQYATGIGGTQFTLSSSNAIAQQVVWNDESDFASVGAGGGGPSELFGRPAYQYSVGTPHHRSVPDISAISDVSPGIAVYCSTSDCTAEDPDPWQTVGGTSVATPMFAGGFALVDQDLRRNHRQPLGLVNPLLYEIGRTAAAAQAFSDVTAYSNDVGPYIGNMTPLGCCTAHPGYDEASGWGSLNLGNFASLAVAAQPPLFSISIPRGQKPVHSHQITVVVRCQAACRPGATAVLKVGGQKAFELTSAVYTLTAAGSQTITLRFANNQEQRLRSALHHHKRVAAQIAGVLFGPHGGVISRTASQSLTIKS